LIVSLALAVSPRNGLARQPGRKPGDASERSGYQSLAAVF